MRKFRDLGLGSEGDTIPKLTCAQCPPKPHSRSTMPSQSNTGSRFWDVFRPLWALPGRTRALGIVNPREQSAGRTESGLIETLVSGTSRTIDRSQDVYQVTQITKYCFPTSALSTIVISMPILLEDLNLRKAEHLLCTQALNRAGSIVEAAHLLGITRHALKRRMIKHRIEWPPQSQARSPIVSAPVHEHRPPMAPQPLAAMAVAADGS